MMIDWLWLGIGGGIGLCIGVAVGWVLCALVTHADTGTPAPDEEDTP